MLRGDFLEWALIELIMLRNVGFVTELTSVVKTASARPAIVIACHRPFPPSHGRLEDKKTPNKARIYS